MKLNDLPHLQQSGFCWSRLTGQKSLRIKPITPVYSVYGDALFMHNALSGHNGNHGRFVRQNKSGIICWPFSTLVCRCLLWRTLSGRKILSLFMRKVSEMPPKAIVRTVSQCSLSQWLSEGIKWNFINKGCNCLVRCGRGPLNVGICILIWALPMPCLHLTVQRVRLVPQPAGDSFKQSDPAPPQDCVFPGSYSAVT